MIGRRQAASLLAILLACGTAAAADVAGRVLEELERDRAAAGVGPLERRPALDAVAAERARRIAAMPHSERLSYAEPVGAALEKAGVSWYRRAIAHLDMVRGYRAPHVGILRSWRGHTGAWEKAIDPRYDAVGAASRRAADGWIVFVAVLLEDMPFPADRDGLERRTVEAVNRVRRERGLPELRERPELSRLARSHSEDMARRGYVDHVTPEGLGMSERVALAGIPYRKVGENIQMSRGAEDPVEYAIRSWLASPGHREAMLDPDYTETGVGVAIARDASFYFTQLFLR